MFRMNQDDENDNEQSPEHWFSKFEDECFDELENQGRAEARLQSSEEYASQQLYSGFQTTSTAIAQLYNCKVVSQEGCHVLTVPFNKAAESLTKFYKDSLNNTRECMRLGVQAGRSNRTRELASWLRKKRKSIRREELLAYLCGRSLPPHAHHHHRSRGSRSSLDRQLPRRPHHADTFEDGEFPVRDAFMLQGMNGAMPSLSYNRPGPTSTSTSGGLSPNPGNMEEMLFHPEHHSTSRKRHGSSSTMDVNMESPSRKRSRFL